jgi:hypothetical protein
MDSYTGSSSALKRNYGHHRKGRSRHEDMVTSQIERRTAQVPSGAFLSVAIGAMIGSLGFFLAGRRHAALFMATWVPTILILGNTNKLVKTLEDVEAGELEGTF